MLIEEETTMNGVDVKELAKELRSEATELYERAKEAGIGFAYFLDNLDGFIASAIVGRDATKKVENSDSGYELVESWMLTNINGRKVLTAALAELVKEYVTVRAKKGEPLEQIQNSAKEVLNFLAYLADVDPEKVNLQTLN